MVALRIATLGIALIAGAITGGVRAEAGQTYRVVVDNLELMTEPNESAYSTGVYRRGECIVVASLRDGWATIKPPAATFLWVDAASIKVGADGSWVVARRSAPVRYAAEEARLPGPVCRTLSKGATVHPVDHPDLQVQRGEDLVTWRAIAPDGRDVRYLKGDGIELVADPQPRVPTPLPRLERLASYEAEANPDLPPEVNAELLSIASATRSVKAMPVESWDFAAVRGRYESLLRRFEANPQVKSAVQARLDQANHDDAIAHKAADLARLIRQGDQRDAEVTRIQRSTTTALARTERKYDAQGLLQPSSRRYQGQKVLALIGSEGVPISYLTIPPGVPINRYLAKKVGVRGVVHFDEGLGARLISVRDLELIDKFR